MWQLAVSPIELVVRTVLVYAVFLVGLRLFGKRELGQFTLFDLALILLAANALQPAMTGQDDSVTGGMVILVTIFVVNRAWRSCAPDRRWRAGSLSRRRPSWAGTEPGCLTRSRRRGWTRPTSPPPSGSTAWSGSRR